MSKWDFLKIIIIYYIYVTYLYECQAVLKNIIAFMIWMSNKCYFNFIGDTIIIIRHGAISLWSSYSIKTLKNHNEYTVHQLLKHAKISNLTDIKTW